MIQGQNDSQENISNYRNSDLKPLDFWPRIIVKVALNIDAIILWRLEAHALPISGLYVSI